MPSLEACTQPQCLLQRRGMGSRNLAELMVRVLAGEDVSGALAEAVPILPQMSCVDCTEHVMHGGRPLPMVAEVERRLAAGRLAHRRSGRRERSEER